MSSLVKTLIIERFEQTPHREHHIHKKILLAESSLFRTMYNALDIANNNFSDRACREITRINMPHIKNLFLSKNMI